MQKVLLDWIGFDSLSKLILAICPSVELWHRGCISSPCHPCLSGNQRPWVLTMTPYFVHSTRLCLPGQMQAISAASQRSRTGVLQTTWVGILLLIHVHWMALQVWYHFCISIFSSENGCPGSTYTIALLGQWLAHCECSVLMAAVLVVVVTEASNTCFKL